MTMPFYASAEQIMRDRSEYARKNIARGRPVVVLKYADGILFVAENPSNTLYKVGEIYDRIGFAAVGRYSEYETLRVAGIRLADVRGYSYDRRDVTGRALANAYAQTLNSIFTESQKPYEVELCVGEIGATAADDRLYRLTYDGSIYDEPEYAVLGGQTEPIVTALKEGHSQELALRDALGVAIRGLGSVGGDNGKPRDLSGEKLEVAVLDRNRPGRAFRRVVGAALTALLGTPPSDTPAEGSAGAEASAAPGGTIDPDADKGTAPDTGGDSTGGSVDPDAETEDPSPS
jgi:proteasome alpha subunit